MSDLVRDTTFFCTSLQPPQMVRVVVYTTHTYVEIPPGKKA